VNLTTSAIAHAAERIPGLRRIPAATVIQAAEVVRLAREHLQRLDPSERRRVVELVRKGRGRPRNLTQREREELARLAAKAEPRLFLGLVVDKLSPLPLPKRLVFGSTRS
jgi:predicted ArsR family transcriptional regulator